MAEPESTNTNDQFASSSAIRIPKCCPPGHVMHENEHIFYCHPLWWWPTTSFWDQPIDPAEIVSQSLSYDFLAYHNVSCLSHRWALANPVNFKRMFPYMTKIIKSNRYFESTWKIKFHSRSTRSSRITGTSKRKFNPFAPICYLSGRRLVLSINHKFPLHHFRSFLKLSSSDSSHFYRGSIDDLCHLLLCSSFRWVW